jgi:antitoxin MazE
MATPARFMDSTTNTQLARWRNSLAVRIPLRVVETARLREGDELALAVGKNGAIVIKPAQHKYQLEELLSKITARNRHDETDWGSRVGEEAW